MAIKDLQARQGNVDVVIDIVEVGEVREFEKFGKKGRVANAVAKDETGDIKLTLWNDDIDKVKAGDKVHISNGYVNEWQGEKQLTTGKFGKMEIVGKGEAPAEAPAEKKEEQYEEIKKKEETDEQPITDEEDIE